MSRSSTSSSHLFFHSKVWKKLKQFLKRFAQGSQNPPQKSGVAAAAILSAAFGCFFLMVNQHLTMLFSTWNQWVWQLGAWIPGSHNPDPIYGQIGSYTGKQTLLLIGWLLSWVVLHHLLKNKAVKLTTVLLWMIGLMVAATVMNWHPFFPYAPVY